MPGALQNERPQKDEARTPKGYPSLVFLLKIKNVDRNHKQNQYLLFERYGERVFAIRYNKLRKMKGGKKEAWFAEFW